MTAAPRTPPGLGPGGRSLWKAVVDLHDLDPMQQVQLLEACRSKDRLDKLDGLLTGDVDTWARLTVDVESDDRVFEVRVTQALAQANATANLLKQLLAALRLPDEVTGKRPQVRAARGAYKAQPAKASARDRLKAV